MPMSNKERAARFRAKKNEDPLDREEFLARKRARSCNSAHLSSSMMQSGVCLRQDTETTLPELTEQHRIRQKEEELSGLESVHMAESETECSAPGLNTLEPECVTARSGVSDVDHAHTSLIKTETDLGSSHTGDLIKTESLDSTELGYVIHLHPDQIKTETDDEGYLKAEYISDLQDTKCVHLKSDKMKRESRESDVMNTVATGAGVVHKELAESGQCVRAPDCKKEEINDLLTQCGGENHHFDVNNENNITRIVPKSTNNSKIHTLCQSIDGIIEPLTNSSKNTSPLNSFKNMTIHRNKGEIHTADKSYTCLQCVMCFNTKSNLVSHLKIHRGEKPYKCSQCEKCFSKSSALNIHLRIHTGEKPYKCMQCEKCFSQRCHLRTHQRIHTGEKPYKCIQCGKSFKSKSNLDRHLKVHTGDTPYECTHCGKCFGANSSLTRHLRIHTGEKPYKCILCGKCFNLKRDLTSHQRSHTGEKPYKCPHCGKCFSHLHYLRNHQITHSDEKPYKCIQCGKCFQSKPYLDKHLRIHTGEKPYKCIQCGKCFNVKTYLHKHLRIHTRENKAIKVYTM